MGICQIFDIYQTCMQPSAGFYLWCQICPQPTKLSAAGGFSQSNLNGFTGSIASLSK